MGLFKSKLSLSFLVPLLFITCTVSSGYTVKLYSLNEASLFPTIIWYSGVTLAVLSCWSLSQRMSITRLQGVVYATFLPLVYIFISTSNLLVFFMCYEFFLIPSFLIVFFGSPNRRGLLASIYFLMWTQVGSFLVFMGVISAYAYSNSFMYSALGQTSWISVALALAGFGIKIPVWPAHYWLTKTHVEAPTYFSIYLSGFLVKTALYGVWVFLSFSVPFYQTALIAIAVIGVVDSSLKMWSQVDLKKLVAYGTVQEMNLILIGFALGTSSVIKAVSLFILAHTILSTIFFLFSDSLYRRFSSRSTTSVRGLLQVSPYLGYTLFICCLFFAGLPFTLKFIVEVYIFIQLYSLNSGLALFTLLICNWFGIVSFMKNWFIPLFGSPSVSVSADISNRELLIYSTLCFLLLILSALSFYII